MQKGRVLFVLIPLVWLLAGCATFNSILTEEMFDFRTTNLFTRRCTKDEKEKFEKEYTQSGKCLAPDLETMAAQFNAIKESSGVQAGDTVAEVRQKGFYLYSNETKGIRVPNTEVLYGDDALQAIGMGIGAGNPQNDSDAERLSKFKGEHYGEVYVEQGLFKVHDRLFINTMNTSAAGSTRLFIIVWKNGHVLRRIIKENPVDNPQHQRAFLLGPGGAITDGAKQGINIGIKAIKPY